LVTKANYVSRRSDTSGLKKKKNSNYGLLNLPQFILKTGTPSDSE
jgi:hypothetical protein